MKSLKDIYFYNAAALAEEIKEGTLSELRAVKHVIAATVLGGIGFEVPISFEIGESSIEFLAWFGWIVMFVILGIVSYFGIWLTYQVNAKGDGKDYFMRFAVLSLPVGIQLMVLFFALGLVLLALVLALSAHLGEIGAFFFTVLMYLAAVAFVIMYFLRMKKYLAVAANSNQG